MKRTTSGMALIDVAAVVGIVAISAAVVPSSLSRARELSKRLVCSVNLKGIGASAKVYAKENFGAWMAPPFSELAINRDGIDYVNDTGGQDCDPRGEAGDVGFERGFQSRSETPQNPELGSDALSVTRSFWMMVRSGDVTVHQFVCPSSGDTSDPTENVDLYYDFACYDTISYGYQVPFGPSTTRPRDSADARQVFAADKGPYSWTSDIRQIDWFVGEFGGPLRPSDPSDLWRPFNSANHGGRSNGEGQNCLFADASVEFKRIPAVGVQNDNIYTLAVDDWGFREPFNMMHGIPPVTFWTSPYPGQEALGAGPEMYSTTDSLIYP